MCVTYWNVHMSTVVWLDISNFDHYGPHVARRKYQKSTSKYWIMIYSKYMLQCIKFSYLKWNYEKVNVLFNILTFWGDKHSWPIALWGTSTPINVSIQNTWSIKYNLSYYFTYQHSDLTALTSDRTCANLNCPPKCLAW